MGKLIKKFKICKSKSISTCKRKGNSRGTKRWCSNKKTLVFEANQQKHFLSNIKKFNEFRLTMFQSDACIRVRREARKVMGLLQLVRSRFSDIMCPKKEFN